MDFVGHRKERIEMDFVVFKYLKQQTIFFKNQNIMLSLRTYFYSCKRFQWDDYFHKTLQIRSNDVDCSSLCFSWRCLCQLKCEKCVRHLDLSSWMTMLFEKKAQKKNHRHDSVVAIRTRALWFLWSVVLFCLPSLCHSIFSVTKRFDCWPWFSSLAPLWNMHFDYIIHHRSSPFFSKTNFVGGYLSGQKDV